MGAATTPLYRPKVYNTSDKHVYRVKFERGFSTTKVSVHVCVCVCVRASVSVYVWSSEREGGG